MSKPTYQQVHPIDIPLRDISVAFTPGDYIADQVFPEVPVEYISGRYFVYNKSDWLRDEAEQRAPGTKAKEGGWGASTSGYVCVEYAMAQKVPDEIRDNALDPMDPLADATRWTTEKILQKRETDVAGLVFANSTWTGSATPSVTWGNDTSDPLGDYENAVEGIVSAIFKEPNTAIIGRSPWKKLKNHPDIVDRIKYSAGPTSPAIVTAQAVAALVGVEKYLIGTAGKDSANEGATANLGYIWGNNSWVGFVASRASLLTPSAGYIFRYGDRRVERFRLEENRADKVQTSQSWDSVVVAQDAGFYLKTVS